MDIDFVVLWVDGNDPVWQTEKAGFSPEKVTDANDDNRYRDWGLMRYWFRAVEKYAPWVRTVHFVTWGHIPSFLNVHSPKLHIVRHEDYMPSEWLPTFSSHSLEMNIHRIPGLAEHFVYFNDDMFLTRPMKKTDFFRKGMPCTDFCEIPLGFVGKTEVWQLSAANDLGIINKWFNKAKAERKNPCKYYNLKYTWYDNLRSLCMCLLFPNYFSGFKNFHSPAAYCKSTFKELWEKEPELLRRTSMHKFRDREDVNQWLALWWQIAGGKFEPRRMNAGVYSISKDAIDEICQVIKTRKREMICLNDNAELQDYEFLSAKLTDAFERVLPEKSQFEMSEG